MSKKAKLIIILATSIIMIFLFMFLIFIFSLQLSHRHFAEIQKSEHGIFKRRFPFPFKSAVNISSDIDGTDSLEEFLTILEFLSTKNKTDMGVGIGLEIGNSFFPIKKVKPALVHSA
ncbi:MAG: hypothetical protein ACFFDN_18155 [Candidatus Hodarchaeota archaeon]